MFREKLSLFSSPSLSRPVTEVDRAIFLRGHHTLAASNHTLFSSMIASLIRTEFKREVKINTRKISYVEIEKPDETFDILIIVFWCVLASSTGSIGTMSQMLVRTVELLDRLNSAKLPLHLSK